MRTVLALTLLALPAAAQTGLRSGDTIFTEAELAEVLSGQVVEFFDGSQASYAADGSYSYRYRPDDPAWEGNWALDGTEVCVTFSNGFDRCDAFVRTSDRLTMIIEDGTRFPIKAVTPLQ